MLSFQTKVQHFFKIWWFQKVFKNVLSHDLEFIQLWVCDLEPESMDLWRTNHGAAVATMACLYIDSTSFKKTDRKTQFRHFRSISQWGFSYEIQLVHSKLSTPRLEENKNAGSGSVGGSPIETLLTQLISQQLFLSRIWNTFLLSIGFDFSIEKIDFEQFGKHEQKRKSNNWQTSSCETQQCGSCYSIGSAMKNFRELLSFPHEG